MSLSKQIADKERTKIKNRKNKKKGKETHHLSGKKVEVISQIIYIYIFANGLCLMALLLPITSTGWWLRL
jgi:hypothetical protein